MAAADECGLALDIVAEVTDHTRWRRMMKHADRQRRRRMALKEPPLQGRICALANAMILRGQAGSPILDAGHPRASGRDRRLHPDAN